MTIPTTREEAAKRPTISVVVAAHNARDCVLDCIGALRPDIEQQAAELIVVDNSTDGTAERLLRGFPDVVLVSAAPDKLIPHLWGIGMARSRGAIVALTTAHFVPEPGWVRHILDAHESRYAGIGGAIESAPGEGIISRAIYFCRYSAYMQPFDAATVVDFAADNASYKRGALGDAVGLEADGFWESEAHERMLGDDHELLLSPDFTVYHRQSFTLRGFTVQRFRHGERFAAGRARNLTGWHRALRALTSPIVPAILLGRISRRVITRKRSLRGYLPCVPVLLLFLVSWAAGEATGYSRRGSDSLGES